MQPGQVLSPPPNGGMALPPQAAVYTIQTAPQQPVVMEAFPAKTASVLGWLQITCGILSFAFGIASIGVRAGMYFVGAGIWTGILFFILTGSFGVVAGKKRTKCWIISFMVMSIITAALGCTVLLGISSGGLSQDRWNRYAYHYKCTLSGCYYMRVRLSASAATAMNAVLILISLAEAVLCIISAGVCCKGVCCCSQRTNVGPQIHGAPQPQPYGGQQVIYIQGGTPLPTGHFPQQQQVVYVGPGAQLARPAGPPAYTNPVVNPVLGQAVQTQAMNAPPPAYNQVTPVEQADALPQKQ